ncbi:cytochrome-c peroxidase [Acuticoccus mangrovi]|uniref:cytochrome-c peroxidase n=1 Tax=Acuticoccus mangrovi TaxID=2796142 RepID=UPI001B3B88AF
MKARIGTIAAALAVVATGGLALAAGGLALPRAPVDADYRAVDPAEAKLGQLLFYDPILSGNRNIACATCHHPRFATSDGLSLSLGEGGTGLGPERVVDPVNLPEQRVPRNAQALFNLGAREFTVMFHDGRIEVDPTRPSGLRTPLEDEMTAGFASLLSAQTMFPVLSPDEMAGHYGESDVSKAVRLGRLTGPGGAWDIIAQRVAAIPDYAAMFAAVEPEIAAGREIGFTDISDAVAAFVEAEWRSDDSPFDAFLRGEAALSGDAARGMALFYGPLGCAACHSGAFQTDHRFHAMGEPQIGPGKGARFERHRRDEGRMEVTGRAEDAFHFRTPSLRNVTETGPWGHAGAHRDLAAFLRDHAEPSRAIGRYDVAAAVLPPLDGARDFDGLMSDGVEIAAAVEVADRALGEAEVTALLAFLAALRDETALSGRLGIPASVPSGLPVPR